MHQKHADYFSRFTSIHCTALANAVLRLLSYDIHPYLAKSLPSKNARVADIGTGTGAWLISVQSSLHSTAQLHGFDISDVQFPSPTELPSNVHFHTTNALQPFSEEHHGQFDLVHLRLLVCALEKDDWIKVATNVSQLLKPGGVIQWEEASFVNTNSAYRSGPASGTGSSLAKCSGTAGLNAIFTRNFALQQHRLSYGWSTLGQVLPRAGLVDVESETVASDRVPGLRRDTSELTLAACKAILETCLKKGVEGAPDANEVQRLYEHAADDIAKGAYITFGIWVWVGRKPDV